MSLAAPETEAEKLYAAVHGEGYDAGWRDGSETFRVVLRAAVEWFDQHRSQWGPGTLPTWYTDAKSMLDGN
jgi:hypothetical protein